MPSTVLVIEARRRRRWYLAYLSSFIKRSDRSERSGRSVQLNGNQLRNARLLHCDAVQPIRNLHRPPVVRDEDELRAVEHPAQHVDESSDVRVVERRVDLVEQAEQARLVPEDREHQRDGGERLLAARQQLHALQPLARRRGDDVDAAFERIVLVEQRQTGAAAAEERAEGGLEVLLNRGKRLGKARLARL